MNLLGFEKKLGNSGLNALNVDKKGGVKADQVRNTAPHFFSAAVIIASLIDSISISLSVAFSGVSVTVTAIDFLPVAIFSP